MELNGFIQEINYTQDYDRRHYTVNMFVKFYMSEDELRCIPRIPSDSMIKVRFGPPIVKLEWPDLKKIEEEREEERRKKLKLRLLRIGDENEISDLSK